MSDHVEALDDALDAVGEDIVLRKIVGTVNQTFVDVPLRAAIEPLGSDELVSGAGPKQERFTVIISPGGIARAQWPGGVAPDFVGDPKIPLHGYKAVLRGRARNIETVKPRIVAGELVRIELEVKG